MPSGCLALLVRRLSLSLRVQFWFVVRSGMSSLCRGCVAMLLPPLGSVLECFVHRSVPDCLVLHCSVRCCRVRCETDVADRSTRLAVRTPGAV